MKNSNRRGPVPTLKKVNEDIYLLSLPYSFGMEQVNCYLFKGSNGYTVVDTGSYSQVGINIWENLMALGMKMEKVVLTHFHIDHIGLAKWFQEKHGIPVYISKLGYQEIIRRQDKNYVNFILNMFEQHGTTSFSHMKEKDDSTPFYEFEPNGLFDYNENVQLGNDKYEVIWTPGHCYDHMCFYQREKQIMVVGDHILEKLSPVILRESEIDQNPLMAYFNSLDKVKDYEVKLALPGHGNIMESLDQRMEEIKSGHIHRMDQIIDSVREEEKTAWQLCQETYRNAHLFTPFMATITRCMYLESQVKIKSYLKEGIQYYYLNE
ncbi:MBL fold metallo-hydrolase [Bacillus sp. V3B]|uniref:MBL fold metallo-hydrolase n=1 Tax=Bacillus sp. V3B TaxID=2804915 RepID=UPI00210DBA7C|nr:MBL fold metallo-hydrolase [Bacillus sp. V3B]MCQ6276051.1 MBL fold metallo-hydrolase [Bacillus sp. V3B]